MIAGVWSPSGSSILERTLESISEAVGMVPRTVIRNEGYVLGGWPLAPIGVADHARNCVSVGTIRHPPADLRLENAASLGGDYALIGATRQGLLLARGRHAGRCLYFARLATGVVACSRLAPLKALLGLSTPNVRTLSGLILARLSDDLGATVFVEIRRVQALQAMLVGSAGVAESRAFLGEKVLRISADEAADELRATLERAIRRSLDGRGRVAVAVSGGLDSSSILALAIANARGATATQIEALNWSFAGPGDDRPYLQELSEDLGIVTIRTSSREASGDVARALVADVAPFIWPTAAWQLASRRHARERGAELILTGIGGDQVFSGDSRVFAKRVWSKQCLQGISHLRHFRQHTPAFSLARMARVLGAPILGALAPIHRRRRAHLAARRWPWAGPRLREFIGEVYEQDIANRDWMDASGHARFLRLVKNDFLHLSETRGQEEAATNLMRVDPLLDDEVVSLVASLPQELMLFDDRQRGLFRHAMRRVLPERIRLRTSKAIFEPAIAEMVAGNDLKTVRELSTMIASANLGLVEPSRFQRHFDEVMSAGGGSRDWLTIWPAITVEAFIRSQWPVEIERS
jgi:asparagine synthase (glutamine-hydrolysing)